MKLAALVCKECRAEVDTDNPEWTLADGGYQHRRVVDGGWWPCGLAVLRRAIARDEQIADERAALEGQQRAIERDMTEERRQRTLAGLRKGGR